MDSVLKDLIESRSRMSARHAADNRLQWMLRTIFRPLSIALMAVVVYQYHNQLFAAAQPLMNRIYSLIQ